MLVRASLSLLLTTAALLACTSGGRLAAGPSGEAPAYHASQPPRPGGVAGLTDFERPQALHPLAARTDLELRLGQLLFAPLWGLDPQLRPYPDLVSRVPTPENGGVRTAPGGRATTVDVRLVPGLRWSDGQPLTADDVVFTWRALAGRPGGAPPPGLRSGERRGGEEGRCRWLPD